MANDFRGRGNLGAAPILRHTENGAGEAVPVANLRVYFDRRKPVGDDFEDRGGFWANVSLWGYRAEVVARLLPKGARVAVEGELYQSSWEDRDTGEPRSQLEVRAIHVDLDLGRVASVQLQPPAGREDATAAEDEAEQEPEP
ncbi:single-stranded DNA-binding protein [Aquisalimonas asiatica]|uniref:Single-stranded DNA-binding protein n=1 Tax=Aquisalimonas asiatica TaxID=406100 RepID=A0A1H8VQC6_9GAMM|nr:single-stranded DNA-binding protein [Aquisalimonas asiatica]SEP17629.1 single-strand DNA-binding protein [Aquisalimonas asiatica]